MNTKLQLIAKYQSIVNKAKNGLLVPGLTQLEKDVLDAQIFVLEQVIKDLKTLH